MSILDNMHNAIALYWAPAGPDKYGQETVGSFVPILVNWRSGAGRTLVIDGEEYTVNHTIVSSSKMLSGGYLLKTSHPITMDLEQVIAVESETTHPRDGQIRNVTDQCDLDDHGDIVYTAMI